VSFLIGHRGTSRLPNLLHTLRSIAGQEGTPIECIVVEQSATPEIRDALPPWVRYIHTPVPATLDYCRAKTFNDGLRLARGEVLIAHDNDFLVPAAYAREVLARAREGYAFFDIKRFMFYLSEEDTRALFASGKLDTRAKTTVVQNLKGGSVAATVAGYRAVGGYDEGFVGWGGEDLEFWERARVHGGVYEFGYLPLVHLWHAPQPGKLQGDAAPAQQRYYELRGVAAAERIARLRSTNFSNEK
jgi:GT2 family glycosyltransferase